MPQGDILEFDPYCPLATPLTRRERGGGPLRLIGRSSGSSGCKQGCLAQQRGPGVLRSSALTVGPTARRGSLQRRRGPRTQQGGGPGLAHVGRLARGACGGHQSCDFQGHTGEGVTKKLSCGIDWPSRAILRAPIARPRTGVAAPTPHHHAPYRRAPALQRRCGCAAPLVVFGRGGARQRFPNGITSPRAAGGALALALRAEGVRRARRTAVPCAAAPPTPPLLRPVAAAAAWMTGWRWRRPAASARWDPRRVNRRDWAGLRVKQPQTNWRMN